MQNYVTIATGWTVRANCATTVPSESHRSWFAASAAAQRLAHEALPIGGTIRWTASRSAHSALPNLVYEPTDATGVLTATITVTCDRWLPPTRDMSDRRPVQPVVPPVNYSEVP